MEDKSVFLQAESLIKCLDCSVPVAVGMTYLLYRPNSEVALPVCETCAMMVHDEGAQHGTPVYDVPAVRQRLRARVVAGYIGGDL